jgi:hypothetical protein
MSMTGLIQWAGGLLPVTVFAAIILFLTREVLESVRRTSANKRKIGALKKLLARECELNLWAMNCLKEALQSADEALSDEPPGSMVVNRAPSGQEHWEQRDSEGRMRRGGALPAVRRAMMESTALGVAELDRRLFSALEAALESTAELDHARGTFVDFADTTDPLEADHFGGFVEWALEQFGGVYDGMNSLYEACTRKKLEKPRLR